MKTRTLISVIYGLTMAAMAICFLLERKACDQIHQENTELIRRLQEATEKLADNQRRVDRTTPATGQVSGTAGRESTVSSSDAGGEAQQLRGEITKLLEQHRQAESLREEARQTQAALLDRKKQDRAARQAASGTVSSLQIVKAEYWTDNKRMDVTDELQDRVRRDNLKAIASNNLKGDPEFGQTKHLTIEYSIGGVMRTNEFRENEMIVLPPQ